VFLCPKGAHLIILSSKISSSIPLSFNQKDNFIPWVETEYITKSRSMLNDMYNYLPDTSPLKIFIKNNCSQLLLPPKGHTGYPIDYFKPNRFIFHPEVVSLPITYV
jgi:hypothetical protein